VRFVARRSVRSREPYRDFEFDFQDQSESRRERAADLIEQWRSNRSPLLKGRADLLLDEFGDVVKWEFQRLLKFRDQRDMTLAE
jgi:DNA primase large subunit